MDMPTQREIGAQSKSIKASNSRSAALENIAVARALCAVDMPSFPARVRWDPKTKRWTKTPCVKDWRLKASSDLNQIEGLHRQFPDAVAGIELGRAKLIVVDLDRHGGPDGVAAFETLVARYGDLPPHPEARTPGDGHHHIFSQPEGRTLGNRKGALPAGIDVRGAGGWIVAPGSVRSDGRRWAPVESAPSLIDAYHKRVIPPLPQWLATIISATPDRPPVTRSTCGVNGARYQASSSSREGSYARQTLRGIADEIVKRLRTRAGTSVLMPGLSGWGV